MTENKLESRSFQPRYLLWAIALHFIGLSLGYYFFTPELFLFAFIMASITAYNMGYFHHMYLSHSSFHAAPWFEKVGVLLGTLTWRGPMAAPLRYAALHRVHHRYSDKSMDPHSPEHGFFHSFIGWNWYHSDFYQTPTLYRNLVPAKFRHNPFFVFCDDNVNLLQFLYGVSIFFVGLIFFEWKFAIALTVYGVFIKTLIVVYAANMVDFINHSVGYRNYCTGDKSTNSFLMAFIHLGGAVSWHNNHHARAKYFTVKKNWWEFDVHYQVLRFFSLFGAVKKIRTLNEVPKNS